jgi:tight adherence protein C
MNIMWIILPVIVVVIIVAVALVVIGRRNPEQTVDDTLQKRLEEFTQRGETVNLEKIELSQPFTERVVYPMARKLGELAVKFTPQNALQSTAKKLELAGLPARLDPTMFLAAQFVVAFVFAGLLLLIFSFAQVSWSLGVRVGIIALFTLLGFYFPQLWITSKIQRRQKEIRKAMPDALDLLTICVEAGLGFEAAMAKVSEKWDNELSLAFARIIQEVQLGKLRRDAMRNMADRVGLNEMTSFVAAVIQSELLGVSMAKVLRIQSEQMRMKRRQAAEEEAHKAPIKMLIPMGLLIFPSLMVVLLAPAGLKLMHSALGAIFFPPK